MSLQSSLSTIVVNFEKRNHMITYTPYSVEIHFSLQDDSQAANLAQSTLNDANALLNPNGFGLVLKKRVKTFVGKGFLFELVRQGVIGNTSTFIASQFTCLFQRIFGQFNFRLVQMSENSFPYPNNAAYVYKKGGSICFIQEQEAEAVPVKD